MSEHDTCPIGSRILWEIQPFHWFFRAECFVVTWVPHLTNGTVLFCSDNRPTVCALINKSADSCQMKILLQFVTLFCVLNSITITAKHISGKTNLICDYLNWFKLANLRHHAEHLILLAHKNTHSAYARVWDIFMVHLQLYDKSLFTLKEFDFIEFVAFLPVADLAPATILSNIAGYHLWIRFSMISMTVFS